MKKSCWAWLVLAILLAIVIGKVAWFEVFKTCGNCGRPYLPPASNSTPSVSATPTEKTPPTCIHCKIELSSSNGSVPPPFHRIETITISEDGKGGFQAEHKIESGYRNGIGGPTKILEQKTIPLGRDRFGPLVADALKVSPVSNAESLAGCAGGSNEGLTVYDGDKAILEAGNYSCGGIQSNPSLDALTGELWALFSK
jgi:hypothetical protein